MVLTGFFDSVGLYDNHRASQKHQALEYLEIFDLKNTITREFDELSFGMQRMVLIARAMVKSPAILILDEPTLGLDAQHRRLVLEAIDHVAENSETQIIFISHSLGERPKCINQELQFQPLGNSFTVSITEHQT